MRAFQSSLRSRFPCSQFFISNRRWSTLLHSSVRNYSASTFYVQGHQDDWQLFSGEKASVDVQNSQNKVVFITLTAGDFGMKCGDHWWKAREAGALASIQYLLPKDTPLISSSQLFQGKHNIFKVTGGNTVSYFMRLPDGGGEGKGFEPTKFQSLKYLFKGEKELTAVDQSTTYKNWTDFKQTLHEIINYENIPPRSVPSSSSSSLNPLNFGGSCINVADYDPTVNDDDHSDHLYTSLAVVSLPYYTFSFYLTYCLQYRPSNLNEQAKQRKTDIYKEGYYKTLKEVIDKIPDPQQRRDAIFWAKEFFKMELIYLDKSYYIREISTGMNCLIQTSKTHLSCSDNTNGEVELREKGSTWSLFQVPNYSGIRIKCLSTGLVLSDKHGKVGVPVQLEADIYKPQTDANRRSWNLNPVSGGYRIKNCAGSHPVLDDNGGKSSAIVRLQNDSSNLDSHTWNFIPLDNSSN